MAQTPLLPRTDSELQRLETAVQTYSSAIFLADEYLSARGIGEEVRLGSRLGVCEDPLPGHEAYQGMLCIPYLGADDQPLTVRFRCIENHSCKERGHGKYRTLPHDHARLYNIRAVLQAMALGDGDLHIAEGECDGIILTQLGLHAIALPGANQWQRHHAKALAGFERIYLWADPDDGGDQMAEAILPTLRQAQRVRLYDGDVNEVYLKYGEKGIYEAMQRLTWA